MNKRDERLETAIKMIEMHLGIYLTKEDIADSIDKAEKRKRELEVLEMSLQN